MYELWQARYAIQTAEKCCIKNIIVPIQADAHTHTRTYSHTCTYSNTHTYSHTHIHTHTLTHTHRHTHRCTNSHMHILTHVHMRLRFQAAPVWKRAAEPERE
jgi:hypothetical protein